MGWDRKRRGAAGGYFYKSVRLPGVPHPVKVYLGRAAAGRLAAAEVEQRRQERRTAGDAARAERAATAQADRLDAELHEWAELLFAAWMVLTGHHLHHGCWRRRMPGNGSLAASKPSDRAEQTTERARKPRPGSRAWEENLANSPEHAKSMIRTLADRARQGKPEAAERVFAWLEKFPGLRSTVRELDDLASKVEDTWVRALTGQDALAQRAARDEVAGMKAELVVPGAGVLERVLASAVVVAYLAHQRAAAVAAKPAAPGVTAMRDRRLTAAQKRLVAAVKALETVARMKAAGVRPGRKLKLFEPDAGAA